MTNTIVRQQELSDDEAVKEVIKIGERFERQSKLAEVIARLDKERREHREGENARASKSTG